MGFSDLVWLGGKVLLSCKDSIKLTFVFLIVAVLTPLAIRRLPLSVKVSLNIITPFLINIVINFNFLVYQKIIKMSSINKYNLILANMSSYKDWQKGIVNRNYFIFKQLEKSPDISKILAIDFLGLRWQDGIKGIIKFLKGKRLQKINDKVYIYSTIFPFISQKLVITRIKKLIKQFEMEDNLIFWSYNPIFAKAFGNLDEKISVFDTVDNWAEHASYKNKKQLLLNKYKTISQKADIIFTVANELVDFYKNIGRTENIYWIPNGVDIEHFQKAKPEIYKHPNHKKPVIGYIGTIQERFDLDLLEYLAKKNQDKDFLIVGPIWQGVEDRVESLKIKYKNLEFTGRKTYQESPEILSKFHVAIIPHKIDSFIKTTNPMKMYEYLSAGLPVVSTKGAGVEMFKDQIYITNDYKNFDHYINLALKENSESIQNQRIESVKEHSWEKRFNQMWDKIKNF